MGAQRLRRLARIFVISTTGRDLGEYSLTGAAAIDWEDIAVARVPRQACRTSTSATSATTPGHALPCRCTGCRSRSGHLRTPGPPQALGGVEKLAFNYPDGPHDAEALFVDPSTASCSWSPRTSSAAWPGCTACGRPRWGNTTMLTKVATVSLGAGQGVTGADITPAGDVSRSAPTTPEFVFPHTSGQALDDAFAHPSCTGAAPPIGSASPRRTTG